MPHPRHDVPIGEELPEEFTTLIEIPKSSRIKYELNEDSGLLCASPFSVCLTISTIKGVGSPAGQDLRCSWAESSRSCWLATGRSGRLFPRRAAIASAM